MVGSTWSLLRVRFATGGSLGGSEDTGEDNVTAVLADSLESKGATLTFENVNYIVKASTTNDKLHLLKGISGYFAAGKMTALMGSRSVKYSSLNILPLAVLCFSTIPNKTILFLPYSSGAGKVSKIFSYIPLLSLYLTMKSSSYW